MIAASIVAGDRGDVACGQMSRGDASAPRAARECHSDEHRERRRMRANCHHKVFVRWTYASFNSPRCVSRKSSSSAVRFPTVFSFSSVRMSIICRARADVELRLRLIRVAQHAEGHVGLRDQRLDEVREWTCPDSDALSAIVRRRSPFPGGGVPFGCERRYAAGGFGSGRFSAGLSGAGSGAFALMGSLGLIIVPEFLADVALGREDPLVGDFDLRFFSRVFRQFALSPVKSANFDLSASAE